MVQVFRELLTDEQRHDFYGERIRNGACFTVVDGAGDGWCIVRFARRAATDLVYAIEREAVETVVDYPIGDTDITRLLNAFLIVLHDHGFMLDVDSLAMMRDGVLDADGWNAMLDVVGECARVVAGNADARQVRVLCALVCRIVDDARIVAVYHRDSFPQRRAQLFSDCGVELVWRGSFTSRADYDLFCERFRPESSLMTGFTVNGHGGAAARCYWLHDMGCYRSDYRFTPDLSCGSPETMMRRLISVAHEYGIAVPPMFDADGVRVMTADVWNAFISVIAERAEAEQCRELILRNNSLRADKILRMTWLARVREQYLLAGDTHGVDDVVRPNALAAWVKQWGYAK